MEQDYTIEEVPVTDSPSVDSPTLFQKIKAYVDNAIAKATMSKEERIAQAAKTLGISAKKLAAMMGEEDEEMEMEGKAKKEAEVSKSQPDYSALEAIQKAHLEAIEKTHQAQLENLQKSIEDKYQAQIAGLVEKVEKAEEKQAKAEEEAEVRTFIQKASLTYRALPLSANKVGGLLHKLSKGVDEATYTEVEALLKALDQQAFTAGLFGEIGTNRTPEEEALEDKIAKAAAESGDPGKALLSLTVEEQRKLLAEERARVGGRK